MHLVVGIVEFYKTLMQDCTDVCLSARLQIDALGKSDSLFWPMRFFIALLDFSAAGNQNIATSG